MEDHLEKGEPLTTEDHSMRTEDHLMRTEEENHSLSTLQETLKDSLVNQDQEMMDSSQGTDQDSVDLATMMNEEKEARVLAMDQEMSRDHP